MKRLRMNVRSVGVFLSLLLAFALASPKPRGKSSSSSSSSSPSLPPGGNLRASRSASPNSSSSPAQPSSSSSSSSSSSYGNGSFIHPSTGELCSKAEAGGGGGSIPGGGSSSGFRCRKLDIGDMRTHSLHMIRADILRKLKLEEGRLPNASAEGFPIPPDYLSTFMSDVQADSPFAHAHADDDETATTEKIIVFSRISKSSTIILSCT
jgi:hypothetical protein